MYITYNKVKPELYMYTCILSFATTIIYAPVYNINLISMATVASIRNTELSFLILSICNSNGDSQN